MMLRMNLLIRRWIPPMLLAVFAWFMLSAAPSSLLAIPRAILVALVIFLLPGYLLQRALLAHLEWRGFNWLPVAFGLSLGVGGLAWGGALLLSGSLHTLAIILGLAITVLIAWNSAADHCKVKQQQAILPNERQSYWPYLLVLGTILFWVFVAASSGALFMAETDNWYYLAIVRRIAQTQLVFPGDPYFYGIADPQRGGPWVALVALVARTAGLEPYLVWNAAPACLMPIAILAHYLFAETLFRDRLAAALSCVFLLYGFGRFTWDVPMMVVSPAGVGFVLFLVALALAWRYIQEGNKAALFLALLTGWTLASVHSLVFAGLLAALGSFAGLHFFIYRDWRRVRWVLVLIVIPALLALPFVRSWAGDGLQTANPIYTDEWGLFSQFGGWHIIKPSALTGSGSSPWAWAFLLSPVLLLMGRRKPWAIFLLSTVLFVALTAFNPLFVEAMLRSRFLPPWGLWRMALQVFQFQFVLGGLGAMAIRWWPGKMGQEWGQRKPVSVILLVGLLGLGFLPSAVPLVKPLWGYVSGSLSPLEHKAARFPFNWERGLEFLQRELPAGSTILADSNTSYFISALTDQYVVSIPYGHSSPFVNDDEQRRRDVSLALNPDTDQAERLRVLDRYRVGFVVLTLALPAVGAAFLSPETYVRLKDRLENDPARFRKIFLDEANPDQRTVIFGYRPAGGITLE